MPWPSPRRRRRWPGGWRAIPDLAGRQLPNRYAAKVRLNVLTEQPPVQVYGPRAQPRPFGDPGGSVVAKLHLPAFRIGPLARSDLGFDHYQRPVGERVDLDRDDRQSQG